MILNLPGSRPRRDGAVPAQALEHKHYKNLEEKNYRQYTHDALLPTAPAQPGLVMWGRKRSDAVMVAIRVPSSSRASIWGLSPLK